MRQVSLKDRDAFVYFDGLLDSAREVSRPEMTDDLIQIGCIDGGPEAFRRFQEEQALGLMRKHRQSKQRRNETQHELVNLFRVDDEGRKKHYMKACGVLTVLEAVQHRLYWDEKVAEDETQRERYHEFHRKRLGRKYQRMLAMAQQKADQN